LLYGTRSLHLAFPSPQHFPERTWRQNWKRRIRSKVEQIQVTCNENIRRSGHRSGYNPTILAITHRKWIGLRWFRKNIDSAKYRLGGVNAFSWHLELGLQNFSELGEDDFAEN